MPHLANDNAAVTCGVIFNDPIAGLIVERFSAGRLGPAMAEHGFHRVGIGANPKHRAELQGQSKFAGLCGPWMAVRASSDTRPSLAYAQLSA